MSFETMDDAMQRLANFSRNVVKLYRAKKEEASDPQVEASLKRAIHREEQLGSGITQAIEGLSKKQHSAMFKWHDARQLDRIVPDLAEHPIHDVDDAVALVKRCDEGVLAYCQGLSASTNSDEVLHLLGSLMETRQQDLREFAWEAGRDAV